MTSCKCSTTITSLPFLIATRCIADCAGIALSSRGCDSFRCCSPTPHRRCTGASRWFHPSAAAAAKLSSAPWSDPASRRYKFWNRREGGGEDEGLLALSVCGDKGERFRYSIETGPGSIRREARILSLSDPRDVACGALHGGGRGRGELLPHGASLLAVGTTVADFDAARDRNPNVLFVSPSCPRALTVLPQVLVAFPTVEWIHCRSAGIDFVASDEWADQCAAGDIAVTNAKGQFSTVLAEHAIMACQYFARDVPRLVRNRAERQLATYEPGGLRGKSVGIVGYGDVGRACAKLAAVYGMRITALRRHPFLSKDDPYCDVVFGRDRMSRNQLLSCSDYVICSAPSTVETRGEIDAEALAALRPNAVLIHLQGAPVLDEGALVRALKDGRLRGAALDVPRTEPLSSESELWHLPNVLLSPGNMDQTAAFMREATEFFLMENLPRFMCGLELLNPVDPALGY